jgi:inhibitor of cysteine peptidase
MKQILLAFALMLMALTPHSPVITESDASAPVVLQPGEDFFIAMQSNPSTGYSWTQKVADGVILTYQGAVKENPAQAMPGAPGQQIFIYHANRTGSTTITFGYSRPFEPDSAPQRTVTFTIQVQ